VFLRASAVPLTLEGVGHSRDTLPPPFPLKKKKNMSHYSTLKKDGFVVNT
jgi:hypothetical protein